jgi:hypothetical protein
MNLTKDKFEFPMVRTPVLQNPMNKTKGFSIPSVDNERDLVQLQSYLNSENISNHVRNRSLPSKVQASGPPQPTFLDPLKTLNQHRRTPEQNSNFGLRGNESPLQI